MLTYLILKLVGRGHDLRLGVDVERLVTPDDGVTHRAGVARVFRNGEDTCKGQRNCDASC